MLSEVTGITDVFAHQGRWTWEKTPKKLIPDEINYVNYLEWHLSHNKYHPMLVIIVIIIYCYISWFMK